jgi:hypothetical protein
LWLECGEDVVGGLGPHEGFTAVVQASTKQRMGAVRSPTHANLPRWMAWRVMIEKNVSTRCSQRLHQRSDPASRDTKKPEESRVNIFERWESQAAVETFRNSGPSNEQGVAMLSASVAEYDIADVRPLFGEGTA